MSGSSRHCFGGSVTGAALLAALVWQGRASAAKAQAGEKAQAGDGRYP